MIDTRSSSNPPSEAKVQQTFQHLWAEADPNRAAKADPLSKDIAAVLFSLLPASRGLSILEAGSGTGKISVMLAQAGHEVTLLDTSLEALAISRRVFELSRRTFRAIQGSMFRIPVPDATYDVVWNAGVIEHFHFGEQVDALQELTRVLKPTGLLITLNPSADGLIYRAGKYLSERRGTWGVGQEFPVRSLQPHCRELGLSLLDERDVLPWQQFSFWGRYGQPLLNVCRKSGLARGITLRLFGGYLKLSIIRRMNSQPMEGLKATTA